MKKIITDSEKIEEILTRSVDKIYPTREELGKLLASGRQIKVYVGIDPTAPYVHIGHSTNYLILERLHALGHKITVLVGDFTAMIGDPTDKMAARVPLTREQVLQNLTTFKEQIGKILDFEDKENPIEFRFNSEWLGKLSLEQFFELAANFTVQQMLERDMFEKRIEEKKPLYVHEFFYPLMQGYDSVAMEVDLEIGGTDQTFNMLAGRVLVSRYLNREKYVLTTTLLVNPATGEKMMSKSLGTGIGLNETPENMFGKTMALPDEGIIQTFIDCTRLSMPEIEQKKERLASGENPKNLKIELAHEIVRMYYDAATADAAQKNWEQTFSEKKIPDVMPQVKIEAGMALVDFLVAQALADSKSSARRLIEEGAVRNMERDEEKITDAQMKITESIILKVGKKMFVRIVV